MALCLQEKRGSQAVFVPTGSELVQILLACAELVGHSAAVLAFYRGAGPRLGTGESNGNRERN